MQHAPDDARLIALSLRGQHAAFGALVQRYQQYVFTLALRYEPQREMAEELAQDVFVKAYKNLGAFRHESRFSTWLYTIVHSVCVSHLRSRRTAPLELPADASLPAAANNFSEKKSTQVLLSRLIKQLPPADAEVVTLYYLAEQSIDEIAAITALSASNIKVRLHRARQKLRETLQQHYPDEIAHLKNFRQ